jgi:hypothetical protein
MVLPPAGALLCGVRHVSTGGMRGWHQPWLMDVGWVMVRVTVAVKI